MKRYFVGIDFGHGETAAWIVPIDNNMPNGRHGESLRLRNAANLEQRTLWSVVYGDRNGNYSLNNTAGSVVSCFKDKISTLNLPGNETKKKAYTSYIKQIYQTLLMRNTDLHSDGKGDTNFYLCVACPTKWNQGDKDAYVKFVNDALREFNVKVLWVINESDAAFFTHGSFSQYANECVLVIDYGSSTIDYTVINCGKKISDDSWSNDQLGASNIEKALLQGYRDYVDNDYQTKYAATLAKLDELDMRYMSIESTLDLELRKGKESSVINQVYPKVELNYNLIRAKTSYGASPEFVAVKRYFKFEYEGNIDTVASRYIDAVTDDFRELETKIQEANGGRAIDRIILSGGASLMPWVQSKLEEIFNTSTIYLDNSASFVVAKGATLYAKAQMMALKLLEDKIREINFAQLYAKADNNAIALSIKLLMPDMIRKLKAKNAVTGVIIRTAFCDFLKGLNDKNDDYCQLVQKELDKLLSKDIGIAIHDAINDVFGINVDVSDVKIHIDAEIMNWSEGLFNQGGAFYDAFTNLIDGFSGRFSFTWDKVRVNPERDKIIVGVKDILTSKADAGLATYQQQYLDIIAKQILEQALIEAEKLFYTKQLFKTTFAR